MSKTNIEWATDTSNFYNWRCTKVSEGCKNCYAEAMAERYGKTFTGAPNWRGAGVYKELKALKAGAVTFVNSMSDTYHEGATLQMIHGIHNAATYLFPDVTFLLLTKRPERALALSPYLSWPKNLWIGTSVESEDYLGRLDTLLQIPAAGHFLSAEPLLSKLSDLSPYLYRGAILKNGIRPRAKLGWVIVGAESGKHRRYFSKLWAEEIRQLCEKAGTPFMFKQGSAVRSGQDRELNGRTYDETPFGQIKTSPRPIPVQRYMSAAERKAVEVQKRLDKWNADVGGSPTS